MCEFISVELRDQIIYFTKKERFEAFKIADQYDLQDKKQQETYK